MSGSWNNCARLAGPASFRFGVLGALIERGKWVLCGCLLIVVGCTGNTGDNTVVLRGQTMGTSYTVKLVPEKRRGALDQAALQTLIDALLRDYNQLVSTYIPDSELSRLNQAPLNGWLSLSPALYQVLRLSEQVNRQSGGAFDVTVGPLVNLWGFGPQGRHGIPTAEEIERTMATVGFSHIVLDEQGPRLKKLADVYIDLSAIAKGAGVDVLAQALEASGFTRYMVEIGGELRVRGNNGAGEPWRVGVEKPSVTHSGAVQAISGDGIGIATSGDYRNYYEENGRRASHTIDPHTGSPIDHALVSVSVVASNCALADAWATALNVLGPERAMQLALEQDLAVYLIVREGQGFAVKYSPAFEPYMVQ